MKYIAIPFIVLAIFFSTLSLVDNYRDDRKDFSNSFREHLADPVDIMEVKEDLNKQLVEIENQLDENFRDLPVNIKSNSDFKEYRSALDSKLNDLKRDIKQQIEHLENENKHRRELELIMFDILDKQNSSLPLSYAFMSLIVAVIAMMPFWSQFKQRN